MDAARIISQTLLLAEAHLLVTDLHAFLWMVVLFWSVDVLKAACAAAFHGHADSFRPVGASRCDAWVVDTRDMAGMPAMPSGHVAAATFIALHHACRPEGKRWWLLYPPLMAYSRLAMRCHTPLQAVAGAAWGAAFFWFVRRDRSRI